MYKCVKFYLFLTLRTLIFLASENILVAADNLCQFCNYVMIVGALIALAVCDSSPLLLDCQMADAVFIAFCQKFCLYLSVMY